MSERFRKPRSRTIKKNVDSAAAKIREAEAAQMSHTPRASADIHVKAASDLSARQEASTTRRARLCLNMIVKNEMANLECCLRSVADYIDCWVICDTGSTDGTQEFVRAFFAARNIAGELHSFPFHNFEQARNAALDRAYASPLVYDYLLLTDADMELVVEDSGFREKLDKPCYDLLQRSGVTYWNPRIVRRDAGARYHGVTHEYLGLPDGVEKQQLHGVWYKDHASGSNRVDKFERDIRLLLDGLKQEPNSHRYRFYLAQSYKDAGRTAEAVEAYAQRASMGGWDEEAWYARLQEARCLLKLGDEGGFVREALAAFNQRPQRAEPLYDLARFYRQREMYEASVLFSEPFLAAQPPVQDVLFMEDYVYTTGLKEEYSIAANYSRDSARKDRGFAACNRLALSRNAPPDARDLARSNLRFYVQPARDMMPSFTAQAIGFTPPEGYRPMNPSATRHHDQLVMVQRCANFLVKDGRYVSSDGGPIKTRNFLLRLDDELHLLSSKEILPPRDMPPVLSQRIQGFEDARLFSWRNALWFSACFRELNEEGRAEQALARIDESDPAECRLSDLQLLRLAGPQQPQKNWMPQVAGDRLQFIHFCDPTRVIDQSLQTILENVPAIAAEHFRGGSQAIPFDGGWLSLIHVMQIGDNRRYYHHRFVWFDQSNKLRRVSRPFFFEHRGIEYAAGMTWHCDGARLVVSYGVNDQESRIATVDAKDIRPILGDAENLPTGAVDIGDRAAKASIFVETPARAAVPDGQAAATKEEQEWHARLQEARRLRDANDDGGFIQNALAAFNARPHRAEPLYDLAKHYRERGMNGASVLFSEPGLTIPWPKQDVLNVEEFVYTAGLKEEYSIAANYARDPARKDRGFAACNWLALNRHVPPTTRDLARSNLKFYVQPARAVMLSFAFRPIAFTPPEGYRAMNPSVARQGDRLVLVQRCVNYTLTENRYLTPDGGPLKTRNFLLHLDDDLRTLSEKEIQPPRDMPPALSQRFQGFEDPRLFSWRDSLWFSACVRELNAPAWPEQAIARIDESGQGECRLTDLRVLQPDGPRQAQKNWMPRVAGNTLQFIYLCDPTRITDEHGKTVKETMPPIAAEHFRGGSQAIPFDGGWLVLIHEVSVDGQRRHYHHRFVWFDDGSEIRGVSRPFYLERDGVEFAAGLAWHPDGKRLVVTYSVEDSEAWIATVDADDIRRILEHAELLPSSAEPSKVIAYAQKEVPKDLYADREGAPYQISSPIMVGDRRQKYSFSITCVENREHMLDQAADAVERTIRCLQTDCVYWFSSKPFPHKLAGTEVINISIKQKFDDFSDDTNRIYLKLLPQVITTDFNIVVQADGFAVNPDAWDDEFLNYDYVGAPWPWMWGGGPPWHGPVVGNGGFSLRSRRLYDALRTIDMKWKLDECSLDERINLREFYGKRPSGEKFLPEDILICLWYREKLEQQYGIKFCPPELASKFSVETVCPFTQKWLGRSFGFHGLVAAPHYGIDLNTSQEARIRSTKHLEKNDNDRVTSLTHINKNVTRSPDYEDIVDACALPDPPNRTSSSLLPESNKQLLLVLGMHRSGTSALTRVLSLCGASLPGELNSTLEGNAKGQWEPVFANKLNDEFLVRHDTAWFDPTLYKEGIAVGQDEGEKYTDKIQGFLEKNMKGPLLVVKDPRITLLAVFWIRAAERAGMIVKIVIPVRHPHEVAASLAHRDGISLSLSDALWLKYNLLAERHSRYFPRIFVEYKSLLSSWRREISRISSSLSTELNSLEGHEVDAFLDPALWHQKYDSSGPECFSHHCMGDLYAAFSAAAVGDKLDLSVMDKIFAEFANAQFSPEIFNEYRLRFRGNYGREAGLQCQSTAGYTVDVTRRGGSAAIGASHITNPALAVAQHLEIDASATPPGRLFTVHGTVLYVDSATGELRHGPPESSPLNANFVTDGGTGQIVYEAAGSKQPIICLADRCQTVESANRRDGPFTPTVLEILPLGAGKVGLTATGVFLCAEPNGRVTLSRPVCRDWETFRLGEDTAPPRRAIDNVLTVNTLSLTSALGSSHERSMSSRTVSLLAANPGVAPSRGAGAASSATSRTRGPLDRGSVSARSISLGTASPGFDTSQGSKPPSSAMPPSRLFTVHGTVLYVDPASGELRHGPPDSSPANAKLVLDGAYGQIVCEAGSSDQAIVCLTDRSQTVETANRRDGPFTPTILEILRLDADTIGLKAAGVFLCAEGDGRVTLSRPECSDWEKFCVGRGATERAGPEPSGVNAHSGKARPPQPQPTVEASGSIVAGSTKSIPTGPDAATSGAAVSPPAGSTLSTTAPIPLFTVHETVVYVDPSSGELRHRTPDGTAINAGLVVDGASGQIVCEVAGSLRPIVCQADRCHALGSSLMGNGAAATIFEITALAPGTIALKSAGHFLCAEADGRVTLSRPMCSDWEEFRLGEGAERAGLKAYRVAAKSGRERFLKLAPFLRAANSPQQRRMQSREFDARIVPFLDKAGAALPQIHCFYEIRSEGARHDSLIAATLSMRTAGHPVRVWSYTPQKLEFLLPHGIEVRAADDVMPRDLFERVVSGSEIRYFSDMFRYAVLYEHGGLWMDTDVVLLRPFAFRGDYFFNLQWRSGSKNDHFICGNVMYAKPHSRHLRNLYEASIERFSASGSKTFGEIGPKLLSEYFASIDGAELQDWLFSPMFFNTIDWTEVDRFNQPLSQLADYLNDERVFGIHLWNASNNAKARAESASLVSLLLDPRGSFPSLTNLAGLLDVDKNQHIVNRHYYARVYDQLLSSRRFSLRQLMVIGQRSSERNQTRSTRLWQSYFPFSHVISVDPSDFSAANNDRLTSLVCDQSKLDELRAVAAKLEPGSLDVIIDDGSHASLDQQRTLHEFFPLLAEGGWYFIEDLDRQPAGENESKITPTKTLLREIKDHGVAGSLDRLGVTALAGEFAEILFFDSHYELQRASLLGGLVAICKRGGSGFVR